MNKGLFDGDIIQYEISFAAESAWRYQHKERGEEVETPPPWDMVESMLESRIAYVCEEAGVDRHPVFFFTGPNNFRFNIARTQPYKERDAVKPFHYKNIKLYIQSMYKTHEEYGLEADDLFGLYLKEGYTALTRDKDIRIVPGTHYGWELAKQPAFGPMVIGEFGFLELVVKSSGKKLKGGGSIFFHAQLLTGDDVDDIPGIKGLGPVTAYNLLKDCKTIEQCEKVVINEYQKNFGISWLDRMREIGRLLAMVRERKGKLVKLYQPSICEREDWISLETGEISSG